MAKAPARQPSRARSSAALSTMPHCAENDCQRQQAEALTRLADVGEAALAEFHAVRPHIEAIGEVVGKWLRFCLFVRKWFPRVGWWLLPIAVTLLTKGSSEAVDALIQAATTALLAHNGGGA